MCEQNIQLQMENFGLRVKLLYLLKLNVEVVGIITQKGKREHRFHVIQQSEEFFFPVEKRIQVRRWYGYAYRLQPVQLKLHGRNVAYFIR